MSENICPLCKGIGFVYADVKVGHPDFGKAIPCRCKRAEFEKDKDNRLLRYSNLGTLTHFTFDSLNPNGKSDDPSEQTEFKKVCEAAIEYAREPDGWFVLTGPSGCGKTHLAAAIGNERLRLGKPAFFISVPDLLERMRASFNPDSKIPQADFSEKVRNAPLLILDDLGVESGTPWAKEKLDQVINHRFINELPTVIVTSVPLDELEDRVRTRLTDSKLSRIHAVCSKKPPLEHAWGPEFVLQREMTFENFDFKRSNLPAKEQENLRWIYERVLDFAASPEGWLVLLGENGCGKTHLAAAIVNYRYREKKPAMFVVVPEFLDHLRSTFSPESAVSYDELFESVKKTPLLVLDDFGEQSGTSWAQEKLYQVINYRYNSRLPTIITTNKLLYDIENRISSRLADKKISTVLEIMAPDYRSDHRTKKTGDAVRKPRSTE